MNMLNLTKQYKRISAKDFLSPNLEVSPELSRRAYLNILEDMQEEKKAMGDQRAATFNIMEDINEAQEELKKRYEELEILRNLVEELGASLKMAGVFEKLIRALKKTLPASVNFAYILSSPDPNIPSNTIYMYATGAIGNEYLKAVQENMAAALEKVADGRTNEIRKQWQREDLIYEMLGGAKDEKMEQKPLSTFSIPLMVGNEVLGALSVSSLEADVFTPQDINLVNTMAGTTAATISRLRQLLESEQSRIQSLVESLSNGVIMFDVNQMVTMANPAAQRMTGLPGKGFYLSEFTRLFKAINIDNKVNEVLKNGVVTSIEEINLVRFTYQLFLTPVRDYEKNVIGGAIILYDITHLKEIDRMKTEFVSVASHQLRTPLTAIKLFIEMLSAEEVGKLNVQQKDYMDNVGQSTERMIRLVNDLLNVSRIETGRLRIEPKLVQIEDFIQDIIDDTEPITGDKKPRIIFEKPKIKLPQIPIDTSLMRQVVQNLLTNAVRYSPSEQSGILVKLEQKNNDYVVSVKDSGIGIPREAQPRIFEKFFRADNAQKATTEGSGLGMYVAKMIIEASGGKIWFESPPKGEKSGTIFYVSIPAKGMPKKEGEKGLVV